MTEMLGLKDVADRIGRNPNTVGSWRHRGQLPEPDSLRDRGRPLWSAGTIDTWWARAKDELGRPRYPSGPDPFWEVEIADA